MDQLGAAAPQMLKEMVSREVKGQQNTAPESTIEVVQKQIIGEMRKAGEEPVVDEEEMEEMDPLLLALFR
jgi:hypothetical protein